LHQSNLRPKVGGELNILRHQYRTFLKAALAALVAGWLCCLTVLSADSSIHQLFHHDQGATHSACLICSLAKGQVFSAEMPPVMPTPPTIGAYRLTQEQFSPIPSFDFLLPPSRGPPAA
jgi:hypothetical protein